MPYKDPEKHKEYQRNYLRDKRKKVVELLGGECVVCTSRENLEVDHIDSTTKHPDLARSDTRGFRYGWSWKRIMEELKLCQLLCSTCHRKKYSADMVNFR